MAKPNLTTTQLTPEQVARFESRVNRGLPDECWEWTARTDKDGYGTIWLCGANYGAHRVAYLLATREWPGTLLVTHRCDNPPCCNPKHLKLGTPQSNMDDKHARGRQRYSGPKNPSRGDHHWSRTHPERVARGEKHRFHLYPETRMFGERNPRYTHPETTARGEQHGNAKLTEQIVREIRAKHAAKQSPVSIQREYHIGSSQFWGIVSRQRWKHVV